MSRAAAALALLLVLVTAPAQAGERFAGVLDDGRLATFSTPSAYGFESVRNVEGLTPGERLVALARGPGGLMGIGSTARLYAVDPDRGRVAPVGLPFPQGLRGARFSLAASRTTPNARLLSDVGQDLIVDLRTGETREGPGLRRADDGSSIRPAADLGLDGRLFGVSLTPRQTHFREVEPGSATFRAAPLERRIASAIAEPTGVELADGGVAWLLAVLSDRERFRQSVLFRFDPVTGRLRRGRDVEFLSTRVAAFAALGRVPEDRTPPRVRVTLPRRISIRTLLANRVPLTVRSSEAGEVVALLQISGRSAGRAYLTRDTPGTFRPTASSIRLATGERRVVRAATGKRLRLVVTTNDAKGNRRIVVRLARLTR